MSILASYMAPFVFVFVHSGNLAHFPSLREVGLIEKDTPKYLDILSNLVVEFDHCFEDFNGNTTAFELFVHPFSVNVDEVSEELQMELLELQSDSDLRSKFIEHPLQDFYRCVPAHRYGKIHKHAQVMLFLFGSTYVWEQAFSLINLNKSKLRNALSDSHLHDILTLSVEPDVERLVKTKDRLNVSHWYMAFYLSQMSHMITHQHAQMMADGSRSINIERTHKSKYIDWMGHGNTYCHLHVGQYIFIMTNIHWHIKLTWGNQSSWGARLFLVWWFSCRWS